MSFRLTAALEALGRPESSPELNLLADALGAEISAVRERSVGEPPRRSRRLLFASGAVVLLHDDAVVAVALHLLPTSESARAIDLSQWIPDVGNGATLDDLTAALGTPSRFAGFGAPFFTLDGGYLRCTFRDNRGWKERGNLLSVTITSAKPGSELRPEDDECPTCADLLVRRDSPDNGFDVDATLESLAADLASGQLTEDAHWVRLADLRPLHASGLMERVETQLTCATCRRILCLTLFRDGDPTFGYHALDSARRRPLESIPPVEEWGDASRIAQEIAAMHYVDHEPGAWFLVEQDDVFYLDARYSWSALIDDSALIRLDASEVEAYRTRGHAYLSELARSIHDSGPYREESRFYARNLYREPDGRRYRDAVKAAVVNHTWIAQRRR